MLKAFIYKGFRDWLLGSIPGRSYLAIPSLRSLRPHRDGMAVLLEGNYRQNSAFWLRLLFLHCLIVKNMGYR
jgi:hypothetical protein